MNFDIGQEIIYKANKKVQSYEIAKIQQKAKFQIIHYINYIY